MEPQQSADIIPFPGRPPAAPTAEPPAERLRRALAALDAALARQRGAVADWRFTLEALNTSVLGLGTSLQDYHASLASLGGRLRTLQATARQQAAE